MNAGLAANFSFSALFSYFDCRPGRRMEAEAEAEAEADGWGCGMKAAAAK